MRKEKKYNYNYIYKITNIKNNKYYIGMHSTNNLDDGYMGSGKRLWYSINYHGKENHVKEILEYLPSRKLLKKRERELVSKELVGEELCLNLKVGGEGGGKIWSEEHLKSFTEAGGLAFKKKMGGNPMFRNKIVKGRSETAKSF